ncbi:MAG: hypothetical protein HY234_12465 [Acidobacteria bacterium]|nr:hypothetical protein [Acidobacteriota bacterium]
MSFLKKAVKTVFRTAGLEIRKVQRVRGPENPVHSAFDEQIIVQDYLRQLPLGENFCVDIGASDGITCSNTYALFGAGWPGLAVECDGEKFAALAEHYKRFPGARLCNGRVTPENVVEVLKSHSVPERFTFLSLDIDGYDYFVLAAILQSFRPSLICTEINEKIPPPIKFTVKWDPGYRWATDHFYGQSISQLATLCERHGYALVRLEFNNAFLISQEICPVPALTPDAAYRRGYAERPNRLEKTPWNADVDLLLRLPPEEGVEFIRSYFAKYEGKYVCEL